MPPAQRPRGSTWEARLSRGHGPLKKGAWRGARSEQLREPRSARLCDHSSSRRPAALRPSSAAGLRGPRRPASRNHRCGWHKVRWGVHRSELTLILKARRRPETAASRKRTMEALTPRWAEGRGEEPENPGRPFASSRISAQAQRRCGGGDFLEDSCAPTTVESRMDHLSRNIDLIRPNIVKHAVTQEVKGCPSPTRGKTTFHKEE